MFAFLGKEKRHHSVCVVGIGGRTEQNIHRNSLPNFQHASRGVVTRAIAVKTIAFVDENCGDSLCGIAHIDVRKQKADDIVALPAEIKLSA